MALLSQLLLREPQGQPGAACHGPGDAIPGGEAGVSPARVVLLPQGDVLWRERENAAATVTDCPSALGFRERGGGAGFGEEEPGNHLGHSRF